jgi:hypothetical protein
MCQRRKVQAANDTIIGDDCQTYLEPLAAIEFTSGEGGALSCLEIILAGTSELAVPYTCWDGESSGAGGHESGWSAISSAADTECAKTPPLPRRFVVYHVDPDARLYLQESEMVDGYAARARDDAVAHRNGAA